MKRRGCEATVVQSAAWMEKSSICPSAFIFHVSHKNPHELRLGFIRSPQLFRRSRKGKVQDKEENLCLSILIRRI